VTPATQDLIRALRRPAELADRAPNDWATLLQSARRCNLVGALAVACERDAVALPGPVARHLHGALQVAFRQRLSVRWEVAELERVLGPLGVPVLLLKGAAYVMHADDLALGRMFGDIDILVPRPALGDVESTLMQAGWFSAKVDDYDQRYYRQWMHEIPPMTNVKRGSVLDIHHTILPLTSRLAPDPGRIVARALPVSAGSVVCVPSPEDLMIHSLVHLMHEGELHNGLRDLHDVDEMARRFGADPGFWPRLVERAAGNDLAGPVALGLSLARHVFGTRVPPETITSLHPAPVPRWLWPVYRRALDASSAPLDALASLLVYVRSHALRMPPGLLTRHLLIKAWRGLLPERESRPVPEL
jgi:hypothetical protein